MKKTLFLFSLIALLFSCSKDELILDNNLITHSQKVKWYGLKNPDIPTTRGVADEGKLWNSRVGISIKFINKPSEADMIEKIKTIASEWEKYAGIKFHFVENNQKADIRIAFDWNGNDWLTWSYTGTDAKFVRNQNEPTAVFGGLEYQDDEQFKGDVLRVFGQILGLEYEQRHQDWTYWKNETQLKRYWESMFEGLNMDWNEISEYVFTPLTGDNAIYPTQTYKVDELSVMAWPYYTRTQTTNLLANFELSEGDKTFIGKLYPKDKQSLPTIQEAWVDAGYFEWRTKDNSPEIWKEGMVALRITELGAKQDTLPNVRDGEQLTSAYKMFNLYTLKWNPNGNHGITNRMVNLIKVPTFKTCNITDFEYMFNYCSLLTSISLFDTSNGINFRNMFDECKLLTTVPLFDTSKGINFSCMFYNCRSLTKIPEISTSNGKDFSMLVMNCCLLTTIPLLDTSQGTNFVGMFAGCKSLITIPLLNTSNSWRFIEMFSGCTSLISIPQLNTTYGIDFNKMFYNCTSLKEKPNLIINTKYTEDMYTGTPFADS